ncbi:MAG: 5-(carboxyamino)imidazole ribonucleotide synthase [Acidimicrobiaceae bacterium]|nr:5-(carboxyamino)imidazole ribonucleotide synthase [Acidimicrobiaceae bacterium]
MNGLHPPSVVGIVGGGQLGRMLAHAAQRFGYRTAVLTGGQQRPPAGSVADIEIAAAFDDAEAVQRFVDCADVITWEFENVDLGVAGAAAAAGVPVRPGPQVIATTADRSAEKRALVAAGAPVAPYREARNPSELAAALDALDGPMICKTARDGYDGKGQIRIPSRGTTPEPPEPEKLFEDLGSCRLVLEQEVPFDCEVSVVVARGADGTVADHGVMENVHVDGILDTTVTPARLPPQVAGEARRLAGRLAEHLEVVGVLCVEMFVAGTDLVVNEMAPRPHNSGHCTIEAASANQFEQQLRAVCGLPLGDGACRPAAMAQLLGQLWTGGEPAWERALADPGLHLHIYGKRDARPGRKMGHLTCVDSTPDIALKRVLKARDRLR